LAIVTRVAEAHDGSITVETRPGGGSIFTLSLWPAAS
jgi:signal transduction histidine kinase